MSGVSLITIFGGSGFLGRAFVQEFAKTGAKIRIATRDPEAALPLKTLGEVGQINPVQANIRDTESIRRAVQNADIVINLVGILYQTGSQSFNTIHTKAAGIVAQQAKAAGAKRFLHMSAIGADKTSSAQYAKSKAEGEEAVKATFPEAVIFRPSIVFGPEDDFFNRFAAMTQSAPFLPLIGGGQTRFQPIYVGDVAKAALKALLDSKYSGHIFELGGPSIRSFRELLEFMLRILNRNTPLVSIPFWVASLQGLLFECLPKPIITRDQVKMLRRDTIVTPGMPGLETLDIHPTPIEAILPSYMDVYRTGGRFTAPQN